MRKLIAILLISLLSLQASWAAAASYCRHEQGAAARHFGHHEHQHAPQLIKPSGESGTLSIAAQAGENGHLGAADDGVAASQTTTDLDCSVCHAHALPGVPSAPALPASDAPAVSGAAQVQHPLQTVAQPRPERPNWLAA